jgi:hypothetical protein
MENDLSAAAELAKRFATEAACRDYLIRLRWPDGFRCPFLVGSQEPTRGRNLRYLRGARFSAKLLSLVRYNGPRVWCRSIQQEPPCRFQVRGFGLYAGLQSPSS